MLNRILDANINRLKEGLRVCEEITRFLLNDRALTEDFKKIRHKVNSIANSFLSPRDLLSGRKSRTDVGRDIYADELKRKDTRDIFFANIQRAKESTRVLEEFSKLKNTGIAIEFKKIRYGLYELEKKSVKKIETLHHSR